MKGGEAGFLKWIQRMNDGLKDGEVLRDFVEFRVVVLRVREEKRRWW